MEEKINKCIINHSSIAAKLKCRVCRLLEKDKPQEEKKTEETKIISKQELKQMKLMNEEIQKLKKANEKLQK
jgi:hypothetical protein